MCPFLQQDIRAREMGDCRYIIGSPVRVPPLQVTPLQRGQRHSTAGSISSQGHAQVAPSDTWKLLPHKKLWPYISATPQIRTCKFTYKFMFSSFQRIMPDKVLTLGWFVICICVVEAVTR